MPNLVNAPRRHGVHRRRPARVRLVARDVVQGQPRAGQRLAEFVTRVKTAVTGDDDVTVAERGAATCGTRTA